jgi:hypothetical protein
MIKIVPSLSHCLVVTNINTKYPMTETLPYFHIINNHSYNRKISIKYENHTIIVQNMEFSITSHLYKSFVKGVDMVSYTERQFVTKNPNIQKINMIAYMTDVRPYINLWCTSEFSFLFNHKRKCFESEELFSNSLENSV